MASSYILTFDLGTTSNKCTLFTETGAEFGSVAVPYLTRYPHPGWAEQDPAELWASVVRGSRALLADAPARAAGIAAIGLSGHMNGCLAVDSSGEPVYADIIHSDGRSAHEAEEIRERCGLEAFYQLTGNRPDSHFSLSKILWLRNNVPEAYDRAAFFLNCKDYIAFKLTGNLGFTDFSDASLTTAMDIRKKTWSDSLLSELGLDAGKFPTILKSSDPVGRVSASASRETLIPEGVLVAAGGGDAACTTRGAGIRTRNSAYTYVGSSSWISVLNDGPIFDPKARMQNFYDLDGESCNICGTVQCAAIAYDWTVGNFGKNITEQAMREGRDSFEAIEAEASLSPPGSNGLLFVPYLMGERTPYWDPSARGAFIGFTLFHQQRDVFRSVREGVVFALRNVLDVYAEYGIRIDEMTLIGGGARSALWSRIFCDVFARPLSVREFPTAATSLGAAMAAGVCAGLFRDFDSAVLGTQSERRLLPDPDLVPLYDRQYGLYSMIYDRLEPIYAGLASLASPLP